jgi:hypothetical protein
MRCHVCNVAVGDGQKFCHECGESLAGVTDRTEPFDAVPDGSDLVPDDDAEAPVDDTTLETPIVVNDARDDDVSTDDLPTGEIPVVAAGAAATTVAVGGESARNESWWADSPAPAASDAPFVPTDEVPTSPAAVDSSTDSSAHSSTDSSAHSSPETDDEPLRIVEATPVPPSAPDPPHPATEVTDPLPAPAATPTPVAARSVADERTTTMPAVGGVAAGAAVGGAAAHSAVTAEMPATSGPFDGVHDVHEYAVDESPGFRLRWSFVFALLALVATVMASVADLIDIRTNPPVNGIQSGIRALADFGTNLAGAGFTGAVAMLIGALLSCFGLRWGAGLAGGAGLALAGWATMTIGLAEVPIHGAESVAAQAGPDSVGFSLTITRDLGYFLVVAVGVLGLLAFFASLRMAGSGGRRGLNPWLAAIGAVGVVALAVGPLIPLGVATIDSNFGFSTLPRVFFAGRLVQLGLIALAGVVGFLSVRTYGLGMVAGGLSVATWLWATSLGELGDRPVGVAVGNLGTDDTMPHAVTSAGLAVALVMLAVSATLAALSRP